MNCRLDFTQQTTYYIIGIDILIMKHNIKEIHYESLLLSSIYFRFHKFY